MALTIEEIYLRYSVRDFVRKIEIKRLQTNGIYENDWQDVEDLSKLKLLDKSVNSISYKTANNNYSFGIVVVGNTTIKLNSKNGQFDGEDNPSSVFSGFIRHGSLIRVRDGYVDKYTDPDNPVDVFVEVFRGFIDITSTSTKVDNENVIQSLKCLDLLSFLLKRLTISDVKPLTSTNLKDLIFEILNRSEFTDFFTVDYNNVIPGYNIQNLDVDQYEGQTQLYTVFENLSLGHSFFYINKGVFNYRPLDSGSSPNNGNYEDFLFQDGTPFLFQDGTQFQFNKTIPIKLGKSKLIKFSSYTSGVSNVYERINWEGDPSASFTASPNLYNKGKTINIEAVTDASERQNLVNKIGSLTKLQKKQFTITIPYYMNINVMDEVIIESPEIIPEDAFIWGISRWGDGSRWRKALQADNIPNNASWLVRSVKHNNLRTQLIVQEIT